MWLYNFFKFLIFFPQILLEGFNAPLDCNYKQMHTQVHLNLSMVSLNQIKAKYTPSNYVLN